MTNLKMLNTFNFQSHIEKITKEMFLKKDEGETDLIFLVNGELPVKAHKIIVR